MGEGSVRLEWEEGGVGVGVVGLGGFDCVLGRVMGRSVKVLGCWVACWVGWVGLENMKKSTRTETKTIEKNQGSNNTFCIFLFGRCKSQYHHNSMNPHPDGQQDKYSI